ncbi:MAG: FAD-dependent oxidoreductase [Gammaproteobacteria bacterium]|nr:FAD-dependent oxidoreductase [Gammaproteobacteria bacterium]
MSKKVSTGVKRRDFLAGAATLAAATPLAVSSASSSRKSDITARNTKHDYDVIVVGGGFAGATAARELGLQGYKILILEARSRLGGRCYTSKFAGQDIEYGGAWVHWLQPHVWAEMQRYGLGVVEDPFTGLEMTKIMKNDGTVKNIDPDKFLTNIRDAFEKFNHDVWEMFPRPYQPLHNPKVKELDKLSVRDRIKTLDITEDQRVQLNSFMTLYGGDTTDKFGLAGMLKIYACGAWNYDAFADAETHYRIETGTMGLITKMIEDSGAKLRLATPIYRIEQETDDIKVVTEDDEIISAAAVVITVPLNTYKNLEFAPALTKEKQAFVNEGQLSKGAKIYIHLKQNIGRVFAFCDENHPFNWVQTHDYGDELGTILSITVARSSIMDLNDDDAVENAIQSLFPGVEVLGSAAWDWNSDPYAMGAWPAYRVGQLSRIPDMQTPQGRLFFGGAFTANGWHEFIDGAVESGLRTGKEVKEFLG